MNVTTALFVVISILIAILLFYHWLQRDNASAEYAELERAMEQFKLEVGRALLPVFESTLDFMADLLSRWEKGEPTN